MIVPNTIALSGAFIVLVFTVLFCRCSEPDDVHRATLEGKISVSNAKDAEWMSSTHVVVDGGLHKGYLRNDGTFLISNVEPSASYVVEVISPTYMFEPVRVDVNSKGKIRVRRLNHLNPSEKETLQYPLKFKAKGFISYFQKREQLKVTDFLFNPMVIMMLLPVVMFFIYPKLIQAQDPETQKEVQQSLNFLTQKQSIPDVSEALTSLFNGGSTKNKNPKPKAIKKK